jgi:hypothetical protein
LLGAEVDKELGYGACVAEAVLRDVFGIEDAMGRLPPPATPYVLPFAARRL